MKGGFFDFAYRKEQSRNPGRFPEMPAGTVLAISIHVFDEKVKEKKRRKIKMK